MHTIRFSLGVLRSAALSILLLSQVAPVARAQFNFGVNGGFAGSVTTEALAGYSSTKLDSGGALGGAVGYRFGNGLTLGMSVDQFRMTLRENAENFGSLRMRPVIASVGWQGRPSGRGLTGHAQIGGGVLLTNFQKGPFITDLERTSRAQVVTTTKNAPAVALGGGLDYFLHPKFSVFTDVRILFANVTTEWAAVGNIRVPLDFDKFYASNAQMLGGIRVWFK